jgi:hypothetical protein
VSLAALRHRPPVPVSDLPAIHEGKMLLPRIFFLETVFCAMAYLCIYFRMIIFEEERVIDVGLDMI